MNALKVYVYNEDGMHNGANWIKGDPKSVTDAILYFGKQGNLMITDTMDNAHIMTNGKIIHSFIKTDDSDLNLLDLMSEYIPLKRKDIDITDPSSFIIPEGALSEYLGMPDYDEPEF